MNASITIDAPLARSFLLYLGTRQRRAGTFERLGVFDRGLAGAVPVEHSRTNPPLSSGGRMGPGRGRNDK
jgi:hypothetical protein